MKRSFSLSLLLVISLLTYGQAPAIKWQKTIGGSKHDFGSSTAVTTDSGCIVAGIAKSTDGDVGGGHGNNDCFIVKLSSTGAIQWKKNYGSSGDDGAHCIINTMDSSYLIAGYSGAGDGDVSGYHGNIDAWVAKISATGTLLWQRSLGGSGLEEFYSAAQTIDSGYILAGITNSNDGDVTGNHGLYDCWIVKLDASGAIQWKKSIGGTGSERASSIRQTSDSCYIITGETESNDGDVSGNHGISDCWVVKLSKTGSILWQKCFGGAGNEDARSIIQTAEGGYIFVGISGTVSGDVTVNKGGSDIWVVKLSSTGVLQWQKSIGGSANDWGISMLQMPDSSYVTAGYSFSNDFDVSGNHGSTDWWVVKIDKTGGIQWQKTLGGTSGEDNPNLVGTDIHYCKEGGYIVAGSSASNDGDVSGGHGLFDYWAVRLDCGIKVGAITGSTSVCADGSIILSDTTAGGVWSVSNTNVTIAGGTVAGVHAGTATVTYMVSTNCGTATTIFPLTIVPCITTEEEPVATGEIIIFPNPAAASITVSGGDNTTMVRIYSVVGQLLQETANTKIISVANLAQGLYIVKLFDEHGLLLKQQKLVKR